MWCATNRHGGPKRAQLASKLIALCLAAVAQASWCQESQYPNKSIRLVVAFAPGGIADTIARVVGQKLSDRFGHPMIVENRAGAARRSDYPTSRSASPRRDSTLMQPTRPISPPTWRKRSINGHA